jgi:hypothetical protein
VAGGDGPHYGVRNSSLALAEFRPWGLAGVGAAKDWITAVQGKTLPITVTGSKLLLSVDSDIPNHEHLGQGYVTNEGTVTLWNKQAGLSCTIRGQNVTEHEVDGCDLSEHVGHALVFEISIKGGAMLYTIGFDH